MRRLATVAVLQLPAAVAFGLLVLLPANTLSHNPAWVSTKTTLAKTVMGAHSYVRGHQATRHNALDLGAWHGYQEVVLKRPPGAATSRISFDVSLERRAYLSFLFNKTATGATGIRLSRHPQFPHMLFTADGQGGFLSKEPFELSGALDARRGHAVDLEFDRGEVRLVVDGKVEHTFAAALEPQTRIGFRGSWASAVIDDVRIEEARPRGGSTEVFRDTFFPRAEVPGWTLVGFVLLSLLTVVVAGVLWRRVERRELAFHLVTLHLVLAVVLWIGVIALFLLQGRSYPPKESREVRERRWTEQLGRSTSERLHEEFGTARSPATYRVLVIGSSQTWGAGAVRLEDVFLTQVARGLNERLKDRGLGVEVMNAGVSGLNSSQLIGELYLEDWIQLAPDLVVVNLSNNDIGNAQAFAPNLEKLVLVNREHGIETLFVKEARSRETYVDGIRRNHRRMHGVAARYDIPTVNMHRWVDQRVDDGFVWWDHVHLASFGHDLVAERLSRAIWDEFLTDWSSGNP